MTQLTFRPHPLLRSPHLQTLLSSRLVSQRGGIGVELLDGAETLTLDGGNGIRLAAVVNAGAPDSPLVIMVHGWLGTVNSPYLRRAAAALHGAGFSVARLLLRDHGGTAHLNRELFNSARIDEVVHASSDLINRFGNVRAGIMGFSLGGNFALRVALHHERHPNLQAALAICPVLEPKASVAAIDSGWIGYRWYFLRKWRRALQEKQLAFPDRYDFRDAQGLSRVQTLTEFFVSRYTEFRDVDEYYSHYRLPAETLARLPIATQIIAAADDPVIPAAHFHVLRSNHPIRIDLLPYGGHCGFIQDFSLRSAVDQFALQFYVGQFGRPKAAGDDS